MKQDSQMHPTSAEIKSGIFEFLRRHLFLVVAVVALVVKLWLTSEIRIIPAYGPHDMSNFIEHARSILGGEWFGGYDNLTLIKRPFFPIYLALLHEFGISLPLGHTLIYALACFVACAAIRPVVKDAAGRAIAFVILLFNPFTYNIDAWIANRSQVNPSVAFLALACLVALFLRRRANALETLPWACGLGVSWAAFWLTREEAIWFTPCLVIFLSAYGVYTLRERRSDWATRSLTILCPVAIWGLLLSTIMIANGRNFGWYIIDEQTAPELVSAYNSLARIDVPSVPYVPVPKAAREIAYSVSPAAKELQAGFDGPEMGWIYQSCKIHRTCTDYGGGFFIWAFRDAVSLAGHYTSGSSARAFYLALAEQIDDACSSKKIACLPKALTTMPPLHASDVPNIVKQFLDGTTLLGTFFAPASLNLKAGTYADPPPNIRHDYEEITGSVSDTSAMRLFSGWLLHKKMKVIVAEDSDGAKVPIAFSRSPDVLRVFSGAGKQYEGMNAGRSRFDVTLPCGPTCYLVITTRDNKQIRFELDHDFRNADVYYHVDNATVHSPYPAFDDPFKTSVLEIISRSYQLLIPWCAFASLALVAWRLIEALLRRSWAPDYVLVAIGVGAGCVALLLLLSLISATSYVCFVPEYMSPLFPFLLFGCALSIIVELSNAYQIAFAGGSASRAFNRPSHPRSRTSVD